MKMIRTGLFTATAAAALASSASAATINVSSSCSFDQAVQALNTRKVVGGCAAGNGSADTIKIPAGTFNIAPTVSTKIGRTVTVVGAGRSSTILRCSRVENQDHLTGLVALAVDGAMFSTIPTVTVRALTLQGGTGNSVGGFMLINSGVESDWANATLDDVRVTAFHLTGVINLAGIGTLSITNSRVDHNDVNSNEGPAGGILNQSNMSITRSTVEFNSSTFGAGIYNAEGAELTLSAVTVNNNSADRAGGGLFNSGHATVGHSTFSGNGALENGGAIHVAAASFIDPRLILSSSTVVFNAADGGGGISQDIDGRTTLFLDNNIISRNSGIFAPDVAADLQSSGRNLITNSDGVLNPPPDTIFDATPALGPLTTVDAAPATHALLPGSAGIDQAVGSDSSTDERGFPRPMDGNNNGVSEYDLGAVEFDPWQTERLAVAAKSSDTHSIITNDATYSNAQGTWLQANAANDFVTYRVPFPAAGTYNIKVRLRRANNRGRFQVQTASNLTGTYTNLGSAQDGYASSAGFTEINLGNFTVGSFGSKYVRFLVTGKNTSSTGYNVTLDYLKITKQ